jgi:hypothetical protein
MEPKSKHGQVKEHSSEYRRNTSVPQFFGQPMYVGTRSQIDSGLLHSKALNKS